MAAPQLEQAKDTTRRWKVQLRHETNAELQYTDSATLTAKLWPGDDRAVLATPECQWIEAPNLVRVIITADDLASLEAGGIYRLRVYVGNSATHAAEATLAILAAPGDSEPLKTYCSGEDLIRLWSKVRSIQDRDEDRTGFEEQRHIASKWLEEMLLSAYQPSGNAFRLADGFRSLAYDPSRGLFSRQQLQAWLDADGLIVSQAVKNAVAYRALMIICESTITGDTEDKTDYEKLACRFASRAEDELYGTSIEIDTNADGVGDFSIDLYATQALLV